MIGTAALQAIKKHQEAFRQQVFFHLKPLVEDAIKKAKEDADNGNFEALEELIKLSDQILQFLESLEK